METTRCPDCRAERDHCHGTLVEHSDGSTECTEDCATPYPVRHAMVVDCDAFTPLCGCDQEMVGVAAVSSMAS